jgi:hypothetical protein
MADEDEKICISFGLNKLKPPIPAINGEVKVFPYSLFLLLKPLIMPYGF